MKKTPLTEIEKKAVLALDAVTFPIASFDKRFYRNLNVDSLYTEKQKKYLYFIFNKYRRQIKNYEALAFELQPDRFDVNLKFEGELFSDQNVNIVFKDTFKPLKTFK